MEYKIAPSLLAADFARLSEEIAAIEEGSDLLHLDLMDGHFVPNLTFGIPVVKSIRAVTDLRFDCHLMTTNPWAFLPELAEAGAGLVTMHVEAVPDPTDAMAMADREGLGVGLVISPPTPWEAIEPWVERCEMVVVMSVHPGFGGQRFMPEVLGKVESARSWVESHGLTTDIQIDGGITTETVGRARDAGANVFVAGSAVFGATDPAGAVAELRKIVEGER